MIYEIIAYYEAPQRETTCHRYCEFMAKDGWQVRLTEVVAAQIRRYRKLRGMSTRELAERCADLGLAVPQPVLSNLELGRRESVSVAELLVLAAALDVPPVLLVAPLGHEKSTEILPGRELGTWDAVLWQSGETRLPADATDTQTDWMDVADPDAVVPLYHQHDRLAEDCEAFLDSRLSVQNAATGKVIKDSRDMYWDAVDELRRHRALMEQRGMLLPSLPPRLAEDLASESPRRRRR